MVMKRVVACLVGAIVLAFPAASNAQTERGAISGLVSDSTKGGLPGVAVTITNTATNQTSNVFTSDSGTYSVTNLSPGRYRVEAALSGFRTTRVDNVQLGAGATTRIDITLEIGNVAETGMPSPLCQEMLLSDFACIKLRTEDAVSIFVILFSRP